MTSNRPYLLRALHAWIVDNGMTPQILVEVSEAADPAARLPVDYIKDGKLVLNISPRAVVELVIADDAVSFHARFNGRPFEVRVPIRAIRAIYARENGKGMVFPGQENGDDAPAAQPKPGKKPTLKVVK